MILRVVIAWALMAAAAYSKEEVKLGERLGRPPEIVHRDLMLIRHYRANLQDFYDHFFIKPSWLYAPITGFQRRSIAMMHSGAPRVFTIRPREHMKTTDSRIYSAAMVALGLEPFIVGVAASDENNYNNMDAMFGVFTGPDFAAVQQLASYFYGPELPTKSGTTIEFGSKGWKRCRVEFRSILGNMLGMNNVDVGGRPSLILPDDIMPPNAYFSRAIRRQIGMRMLGVIDPLGRKGARIVGNGTPMDAADFIGRKICGELGGYVITPPEDRAAYNRETGAVLWPERWTFEELEKKRQEFIKEEGGEELFERYFMCSVVSAERKPLASKPIYRYNPDEGYAAFPFHMNRVFVIDFSLRVGADDATLYLLGMDPEENVLMLDGAKSNTWDDDRLLSEGLGMVKRWKPNKIVIQRNTDSITFIRTFDKFLRDNGESCEIEQPNAAGDGSKNSRIIGQLQWRLKARKIQAPVGAEWGDWFDRQANDFEHDNDDNQDDVIDGVSLGTKYLTKPEPIAKPKSKLDEYIERMERMRDDEDDS